MELTLKNYKQILSKELIKKAEQNKVRECDEVQKGCYQAYVDEKEVTYDTFLEVNSKGEIKEHHCDCQNIKDFCHHQIALLLFVVKEKKVVAKLSASRKVDPLVMLMNEVDPEALKVWLLGLFTKNEALALTFSHHFSPKQELYKVADVMKITLGAVKAVIKNRRNIDITEVKQIVELWEGLHEPIVTDYCTQLADEASFLKFHAITEACEAVQYKLNTSSSRFAKYQESLLSKVLVPLNQLQDETYWDKAVSFFADHLYGTGFNVRTYYLSLLTQLHELSEMDRKQRLARDLMTPYIKFNPKKFNNSDAYTAALLKIVVNSGLFQDYYLLFKPIRYQNDYNGFFIGLLIEHDYLALAEKFCNEQIAANSRGDFDVMYLNYLIQIYERTNEGEKLALVLKETLPHTLDFNAYVFVDQRLGAGEEKSKWRNKVLARSRHLTEDYLSAMTFSFQLLDYENNYKKMIAYVDSNASYEVILKYADKMALTNRNEFLKNLLYKGDRCDMEEYMESQPIEPVFTALLDILLTRYSSEELKLAIKEVEKKGMYYLPNSFVQFLSKSLKGL
jgi:hypothetical protein